MRRTIRIERSPRLLRNTKTPRRLRTRRNAEGVGALLVQHAPIATGIAIGMRAESEKRMKTENDEMTDRDPLVVARTEVAHAEESVAVLGWVIGEIEVVPEPEGTTAVMIGVTTAEIGVAPGDVR